jgi:hypothetical protein
MELNDFLWRGDGREAVWILSRELSSREIEVWNEHKFKWRRGNQVAGMLRPKGHFQKHIAGITSREYKNTVYNSGLLQVTSQEYRSELQVTLRESGRRNSYNKNKKTFSTNSTGESLPLLG